MIAKEKEMHNYMVDIPTFEKFGNIYKGDYYEDIPFYKYIKKTEIPFTENRVFKITDYGAKPSNVFLNTDAVQQTIDACKIAGGGVILVEGGNYIVGTIRLYSNMTLFIADDAALVASRDLSQYKKSMIECTDAEHVTLTGGGKIIGNGEWFVYEPLKKPLLDPLDVSYMPPRNAADINNVENTLRINYRQRIRYSEDKYNVGLETIMRPEYMVWFYQCRNLTIHNIILEDSMNWTLNLDCCESVHVFDVVINNNRHVANTDGIDITGSSHVRIENCFISTADDGIVVKNPEHTKRDMTDIYISNCTVISVMNNFKIGTETKYDISDIVVEDCVFLMPDIFPGAVSGISIESADGSIVRDISISRIKMEKVICPVFIALNMRNRYGVSYENHVHDDRKYGGTIENIRINDITAIDAEAPTIISGFQLAGTDMQTIRQPIKKIAISNLKVIYRECKEIVRVPENIEEYLTEYPENNNFGDVDAYGIWARHVDDLELINIDIIPRSSNQRDKIKKIDIQSFTDHISNYIESELRKRVQVDGGDMSFVSVTDDILTIRVYADCAICTHVDCNLPWWIEKRVQTKFGKSYKVVLEKDVPYYYKKH